MVLVDVTLLVAVLDPAGAAAGADGDRVQTEGDGDQGRSAQRAAWHDNLSDLSACLLVAVGWRAGMRSGLSVGVGVEGCLGRRQFDGGRGGGGRSGRAGGCWDRWHGT